MFSRVLPRPSLEAVSRLLTSASLPTSDLTEAHMEHFYYCGPAEQPTGVVGLEFCGEHVLLRSLWPYPPNDVPLGLRSWLLAFAENEVLDRGIDTVYLLTTTAENFFHRRGYPSCRPAGCSACHSRDEGIQQHLSGELCIHAEAACGWPTVTAATNRRSFLTAGASTLGASVLLAGYEPGTWSSVKAVPATATGRKYEKTERYFTGSTPATGSGRTPLQNQIENHHAILLAFRAAPFRHP